jgi:hypothetical protein
MTFTKAGNKTDGWKGGVALLLSFVFFSLATRKKNISSLNYFFQKIFFKAETIFFLVKRV